MSTRPARPPVLAVAAPAAMLVAEALFLMYDRRPWAWNLTAETYRLIDLGVAVAMIVGGLVLPWVFVKEPRQRGIAYLVVAVAGTFGAFAFVLLERIIVAVA